LKNWGTNGTIHSEDLPHFAEVFTRSIAAGVPYNIEARLRRFDGEYRWFDSRGTPIRDETGRIARWYVLLTDIEDRTQALTRLQHMQSDFARMNRVGVMGELAASLSHEITQPIASARNNARAAQNFLDKQPPDLREVMEALGYVVRDAGRAGDIVDRIREHIRKAPLFDRSAAAFDNPDHVDIVIHNYRWRLGLGEGEPKFDVLEKRLAEFPVITVPTITLQGDADGAPRPDPSSYANKFSGKYEHRSVTGGIGHNLPQEAPQAFANAIVDAAER